jgi:hypothetical protein
MGDRKDLAMRDQSRGLFTQFVTAWSSLLIQKMSFRLLFVNLLELENDFMVLTKCLA